MARSDLGPFYRDLAALFEVPQQSPSELDFIDELAVDARQAPLLGINPDLARHFVKNLPLAGRRLEARIGLEDQFDSAAAFPGVLKEERVRDHLEKPIALFSIFSLGLFELVLLFRIMREPQYAFGFPALLGVGQRFTRNGDQAVKRARFGFDYFSGFLFAVLLFDQQILPAYV